MSGRKRYRLLMIDDDASLNELLVEYFDRFGHTLTTATTAAAGRALLRRDDPDLLILDVMLPDADGMELCRSIRSASDVPIVMLTARGDLPDRILGLEFGADDYIPKPFEPRELVARVETLMRRSRETRARRLTAGGLALETETRRVFLHGAGLELTSLEFELLRILMESGGRVLTREMLLRRLRGIDSDIYDRSVDMLISRLRRKLADDSRSPRYIKTIWRNGYQFVGGSDP
ncbi:MAG TPA: response regulator transcription factor [Candidatus Polarisedimenticolia bacterium]|nr:response regulator transcription factor [Candidatus Polarisedimenticolia bacterium]